jgi:hypothetical protein
MSPEQGFIRGGQTAGAGWVNLDPAFKSHKFLEAKKVTDEIAANPEGLFSEVKAGATVGQGEEEPWVKDLPADLITGRIDGWGSDIAAYAKKNKLTLSGLSGGRIPEKDVYSLIPPGMAGEIQGEVLEYESLPEEQVAHKVIITLEGKDKAALYSCDMQVKDLRGRKVTLSWDPADEGIDGAAIDEFIGESKFPAYLVELKPSIKVEGVENVAYVGSGIAMGEELTLRVDFMYSPMETDTIERPVKAGEYLAFAFSGSAPDWEQAYRRCPSPPSFDGHFWRKQMEI